MNYDLLYQLHDLQRYFTLFFWLWSALIVGILYVVLANELFEEMDRLKNKDMECV